METSYRGVLRILVVVMLLSIESGFISAQDPDIAGVMFSDYTYALDDGQNIFNIRRTYLNIRGNL